jgi:hypothetical protein
MRQDVAAAKWDKIVRQECGAASATTNLKKCDNDDMFMGVRADAGLPQQLLDLPSEGAVRSILVLHNQDVKMARC